MYNVVMDNEERLLTLEEAANMLGLNKVTLRRWSNLGKINVVRIGKRQHRRFKLSDIQRIVEEGLPNE